MNKLTNTAKKILTSGLVAGALKASTLLLVAGTTIAYVSSAQAGINKNQITQYAENMRKAANEQNIGKIAQLVSDKAIISLSGNGRKVSLDKNAYLKLLQRNWRTTTNYRYSISISNIVILNDNKASANVITKESYTKNGKTYKFVTTSDAKFALNDNNAVLLRSVSQITTKR